MVKETRVMITDRLGVNWKEAQQTFLGYKDVLYVVRSNGSWE